MKRQYLRDGRAPLPKNEHVSRVMSANKGSNTSVELGVFKFLRGRKIYFQKHYRIGRRTIDIALPGKKIGVFIDGDFWHGWRYPTWRHKLPSNFWRIKIERNRQRDRETTVLLRRAGWRILRVWEHQLCGAKKDVTRERILDFLRQQP